MLALPNRYFSSPSSRSIPDKLAFGRFFTGFAVGFGLFDLSGSAVEFGLVSFL